MSERGNLVITVQTRDDFGKSASSRIRREGHIPAVVYGGDRPAVPIVVEETAVKEVLSQAAGENTIFLLKLPNSKEQRETMIKEIQKDPISGKFLHIDFIRITRGHKVHVMVPVELTGDCLGIRQGGRMDFVTRELGVEVLPREMLDKITVNVSDLDIGDNVVVGDLQDRLPPSGKFADDPQRVVVLVEAPRGLGLEEEEAEGELVIEEAEEPELIRRGRGEEGEGEEGE